jgi:quercetin dioxygenase-like cupin family protein
VKVSDIRGLYPPDCRSTFEDDEVRLETQHVADGVPPMLVGSLTSSGSRVTFLRSDGFDSEPHPAPGRQWVVLLRGNLEVEVSDGTRRRIEPGDLVFVADTTGRGHITRALGEPPFEALFVSEG